MRPSCDREASQVQANTQATSRAAISHLPRWNDALDEVLAATTDDAIANADLGLLFASYHHQSGYQALLERVRERAGVKMLVGCSGQGVIGPAREVEGEPAVSLLLAQLPGVQLQSTHVTQPTISASQGGESLIASLGMPPATANAFLVLADPFRIDVERLIALLEEGYPNRPLVGGLASASPGSQSTQVFQDDIVHDEGAVVVAIGGAWTLRSLVSQGATPIGEPWTITGAHDNILESVGGRPAYEVLAETVQALPDDIRRRAISNLLIGLAMDEYRESHNRGDFLIRNLMGVDRESGALAVSAYPRIGQTVQFQMRDGQAADEELVEMLRQEQQALGETAPAAAMLCSCNGRGVGLFGQPDHDARRIAEELGPVPLAGFFCNGEIGPVAGKTFLHGFTASLALFVPKRLAARPIRF
jgi:small ligand-binding sensory domain FIST